VYVQSLIEKSRQMNSIAGSIPETLLHYKRGLFGERSLIDDPRFFYPLTASR
jgi:hypothetical protein